MRATWKGYLKIQLVTIPVKMYAAARSKTLRLNLLHGDCSGRVKQQYHCGNCDAVIPYGELVRGYEYAKDAYVVLGEEDFEKAKKESSDAIEVVRFIEAAQIDPIYYNGTNYLAPDGPVAADAFALFHPALAEDAKVAEARAVIRNREQLFAIRPYARALAAHSLHFAQEIQSPASIEPDLDAAGVDESSLDLARRLIDNLSGDFALDQYVDEYTKTVMEIIKAKAEGEEIAVAPQVEKAKIIHLMDALRESVAGTAKAAKAQAPKAKPAKAKAPKAKPARAKAPKKKMAAAGKRAPRKAKKAAEKA
jgi:DNA end-binding protein Ku